VKTQYTFIKKSGEPAKTRHFLGFPPQLTEGIDTRREIGRARAVILSEDSPGVSLDRLDAEGKDAGDTWHQNREDALDQATFEYPDAIEGWQDIPNDVEDAVAYARHLLRD